MPSSNANALRFCAMIGLFFMLLSESGSPQWLHSPATLLGVPMLGVCAGFAFAPLFYGGARQLTGIGLQHLYLPAIGWGLAGVLLHSLSVWLCLSGEPPYGFRGTLEHALGVVFALFSFDHPLGAMLHVVRYLFVGGLLMLLASRVVRHLYPSASRLKTAWTMFGLLATTYVLMNSLHIGIVSLPQGGALEVLTAALMSLGVVVRQYDRLLSRWTWPLLVGSVALIVLSAFVPIRFSYTAGLLSGPVQLIGGAVGFVLVYSCALRLEPAALLPLRLPTFTLRHGVALLALAPLAFKPVSALAASAVGMPIAEALRALVVPGAPAGFSVLYALCGFALPMGLIAGCGWLERHYTLTARLRQQLTLENLARLAVKLGTLCVKGAKLFVRYSYLGVLAAGRGLRWLGRALWRGLKALGRGLKRAALGVVQAAKDIVSASSPRDE